MFYTLVWIALAEPDTTMPRCAIIADAGSSGTRTFFMAIDGKDVIEKSYKHLKGGIAEQFMRSKNVNSIMDKLRPILAEARDDWTNKGCPGEPLISILGTAGTRLMPDYERKSMWSALADEVLGMKFRLGDFRTLTGFEEGIFALIAANHLAGAVDTHITPTKKPFPAILDMGGASTQSAGVYMKSQDKTTPLSRDDVNVHSYLGYGQNEFKTFLINQNSEAMFEENCLYPDDIEAEEKHPCYGFVKTGLFKLNKETDEKRSTYPEELSFAPRIKTVYMISGYIFAARFAQWVDPSIDLSVPVSLRAIRSWADTVCREDYDTLKSRFMIKQMKHTTPSQFEERCFHLWHMVALLEMYGFRNNNENIFFFTDNIAGKEIGWPLGAFLYQAEYGQLPDTPTTPYLLYIALALAIMAVLTLVYHQRICLWWKGKQKVCYEERPYGAKTTGYKALALNVECDYL